MITPVSRIPDRTPLARNAYRLKMIQSFLDLGYPLAEYQLESGDAPRRAYNGLMMAIKCQYAAQVRILWRKGHIYLVRIDTDGKLNETNMEKFV